MPRKTCLKHKDIRCFLLCGVAFDDRWWHDVRREHKPARRTLQIAPKPTSKNLLVKQPFRLHLGEFDGKHADSEDPLQLLSVLSRFEDESLIPAVDSP